MKWKVLTYGTQSLQQNQSTVLSKMLMIIYSICLKMRVCQRLTLGISQKWVVGKILSEIFPYKNISLVFTHLNPNCLDM